MLEPLSKTVMQDEGVISVFRSIFSLLLSYGLLLLANGLFNKSLFKFAYQEEWVTKNRAEGLKSPRSTDPKKREAFTSSEINLIFHATVVVN